MMKPPQVRITPRFASISTSRLSMRATLGLHRRAIALKYESEVAAAVLGHNFPDSQWYHDAYDLLKGKGLSPHDFGGSWLSTIWRTVVPSSSG